MTAIQVLPVVMAGGNGTRLWPLSRAQHPKQFLVFEGNHSLLQLAALRLSSLGADGIDLRPACVVGNEEHRFVISDQLGKLPIAGATVLLEPVGRNTAPAMTLAALHAQSAGTDPVMVVSPADQAIVDEAAFRGTVQRAIRTAADGAIVLLGVVPDRPETGFGYIRAESTSNAFGARTVAEFVEKPDLDTAKQYVQSGNYYWNSGIFVVRASVWLQAVRQFRPDIASATLASWEARTIDAQFLRPGSVEFAAVPSESVDYAVMEKCTGAAATAPAPGFDIRVVALDAGWSDLGAWDAVWQVGSKDSAGNAVVGDAFVSDCRNTLVHATGRLVAVVGLSDVVVVETPDAVLVTDRSRSQEVKSVVNRLERQGRSEHTLHRQVHRPWGWYDSIDAGERFKVKRIMVNPGASLSLQMHHHRAEHWIIVTGTAEITNGDQTLLLTENQSTYIPVGTTHRLANPGKVPLEIIEVQSGSYLEEDDIVRFDDHYGRAG